MLVFFTKLSFILFTGRCFFLLIHFLVVEDYELSKSTSHVSLPLTLECDRILSWSISFFFCFNCLPDDFLCKIAIRTDDTALDSYPPGSQYSGNILCNVLGIQGTFRKHFKGKYFLKNSQWKSCFCVKSVWFDDNKCRLVITKKYFQNIRRTFSRI